MPCRKLGDLKNGEQKTFVIDSGIAKVFVVADQLSKNISNEFFPLGYGDTDVFLSGSCIYNPAAGNPFRFDGIASPDMIQNRKSTMKKSIVFFVIIAIVCAACSFVATSGIFDNPEPETFNYKNMSLVLTDDFEETEMDGFERCYDSERIAVFVIRERFDDVNVDENYSLDEYGELVMKNNGMTSDVNLQHKDGLTYFEFEAVNDDGEECSYFVSMYKAEDAFWIVQFAGLTNEYDEDMANIIEWAKSVQFSGTV